MGRGERDYDQRKEEGLDPINPRCGCSYTSEGCALHDPLYHDKLRARRCMMEALRYLARRRCIKKNCGTACLCAPCSARAALEFYERRTE
jgi:hypothetical protein